MQRVIIVLPRKIKFANLEVHSRISSLVGLPVVWTSGKIREFAVTGKSRGICGDREESGKVREFAVTGKSQGICDTSTNR